MRWLCLLIVPGTFPAATLCAGELYSTQDGQLVVVDTTTPGAPTVIGALGLPPDAIVVALTHHRIEGAFFALVNTPAAGSGQDQSLYRIDPDTGAAALAGFVSNNSGGVNYEATVYVDALESLVAASGQGFVSSALSLLSVTGESTGLSVTGLDNDYGAYDSTRDILYTTDPNGAQQLVVVEPATGAASIQGTIPLTMGALAYSPTDDALFAIDYTNSNFYRIDTTNGAAPIMVSNIGVIGGSILRGLTARAPACPADVDGDGDVDFADLNLLLASFNMFGQGLPGDVDGDGDVDFADLNALVSVFNTKCA